jgi:CheY-like chemotaxis protein
MKPKILCVDDEMTALKNLDLLLSPNGYEVIQAFSCEEALERLKGEKVNLALLDAQMPKLDGFEFCRILKTDERTMNIPVILAAEAAITEDRIKGIEAGADDFISKPFDPPELLERIKTLLHPKQPNERRLGELLLDMHFINEAELQAALKIAKEKKIKLGEALIFMGAIDQDHIYWALSNQLKMNYIELSYDMIDSQLVREFSLAKLERFQCLPLYETIAETHFAIADPTDQDGLRAIRELNPLKRIRLHLAMPEKIHKILERIKQEVSSPPYAPAAKESSGEPLRFDGGRSPGKSEGEKYWSLLVEILSGMSPNESCWLYNDFQEARFIHRRGKDLTTEHRFPYGAFDSIRQKLNLRVKRKGAERVGYFFNQPESSNPDGPFLIRSADLLGKDLFKITRVPAFSEEKFSLENRDYKALIDVLQTLLNEYGCLLIGGQDGLWIKQHCYMLAKTQGHTALIPPPFFVEDAIEMYFAGVAQSLNASFTLGDFWLHFNEENPLLFCQTSEADLSSWIVEMFSGRTKNMILHIPFSSPQSMREALRALTDWPRGKRKSLFMQRDRQEIL